MSATFGKGSRQKKKRCVKPTAYPCKFACINKEKICRNGLEGQAKTWALWLQGREERLAKVNAHRANKGRSQFSLQQGDPRKLLVKPAKNNALAQFTKKRNPFEELDKKQAAIDAKYASSNPSDRDVNKWVAESIRLISANTPENITRLAAKRAFKETVYGKAALYIGQVYDEDSFLRAFKVAMDNWAKTPVEWSRGKSYAPLSYDYWLNNVLSIDKPKYEEALGVINNPRKGEKAKAKARKIVEGFPSILKEAEQIAKRQHGQILEHYKNGFQGWGKEAYDKVIEKHKKDASIILGGYNSNDYEMRELGRQGLESFLVYNIGSIPLSKKFEDLFQTNNNKMFKEYLISKSPSNIGHKFLGSPRNTQELKKAFKVFAAKHHPDRGGDTKLFQSVSAHYNDLLSTLSGF